MKSRNRFFLLSLILVVGLFALYQTGRNLKGPLGQPASSGEGSLEDLGLDELVDGYFTLLDDEEIASAHVRIIRSATSTTQPITSSMRYTVEGRTAYARYVKDVDLALPAVANPAAGSQKVLPVQQGKAAGKLPSTTPMGLNPTYPAMVPIVSRRRRDPQGWKPLPRPWKTWEYSPAVQGNPYPHDAGAYDRSRRTAEELLQENPDALFDVHRDAVPAEEYTAKVDGEQVAQIQLVVGQQTRIRQPLKNLPNR